MASSEAVYICIEDVKRFLNAGGNDNMDYNNYNRNGMVTMYEETGSRMRGGHEYADGYDSNNTRNNNNRREYHQGRSASPNRNRPRNSRGRDRSRSPHQFHERVYDDFAARDYDSERPSRGYRSDHGYERDYRDTCNDRDSSRHSDRDRRAPRYRESRDNRSDSRERFRERDNNREQRDNNREPRDNNREPRDNNREQKADRDEDYHGDRDRRRSRESRDTNNDYPSTREEQNFTNMTPPSSTIILQNIGPDCTEQKIQEQLVVDGLTYRNVAVIRERNGENKGYAFVEFDDINTAEKWLKVTKRAVTINGRTVQLNFSKSRKNDPNNIPDWYCIKCNVLNFGSRKRHDKKPSCYQCGSMQIELEHRFTETPKNVKETVTGEVIKVEPCNVLMVRGMDFSTTEEMIRAAIGVCTTRPIYDVRLIRDKVTDVSRGFAFIEMGSVQDACDLLETVEKADPPFNIVGRRITIGYARHGYNAPLNGKKGRVGLISKQTLAENAVAQASSAKATAEYSQSVADSYASAVLAGRTPSATTVPSSTITAAGNSTVPSSYTYDASSGYYYDSSTSLYYDPNTGYYYNSVTSKWLFWNGSRYQAVNPDGTPVTSTSSEPATTVEAATTAATTATETITAATDAMTAAEEGKKFPDDKEKVAVSFQKPKTARKIAKDMERWAKKMNTATEARKIAVKQAQDELRLLAQKEEELRQQILQEKPIGITMPEIFVPVNDNIRSLFVPDNDDEGSVLKLGSALSVPPSKKPKATTSVIAADLPEDDDFIDESKFADVSKMACLLCKRQFPSKDVLTKHLQMSQLHKENLEKYKKLKQAS